MLSADAVHNTTTGLTRQSGIVSRIFLAQFLSAFGSIFALVARGFLGGDSGWIIFPGFVLGSLYVLCRAVQTYHAWSYVKFTPS